MTVEFRRLPELVIMLLDGCREPRCHDVSAGEDHLRIASEVVPTRVERFSIRIACRLEHRTRKCSAGPVFVGDATCEERSPAVSSVPKESRPDQPAGIASEI